MKSFDTNIGRFGGLNQCQLPALSSLNQELKNKLLHKNWIRKKLRHQNRIIVVILKFRLPNVFFAKTSGMPPMFGAFLISISILPIPSLP
jgi:hypothetical protein